MIIGLTSVGSIARDARAETTEANRGAVVSDQAGQPKDSIEDKPFNPSRSQRDPSNGTDGPQFTPLGWWTYGALAGVVLLILAAAVIIRKAYPGMKMFSSLPMVQILGRTYLSPKQTMAMIKVDRRLVLLGVTEHSMTNLLTISDPEEVSRLMTQIDQHRSKRVTTSFGQLFTSERKLFGKTRPSHSANQEVPETVQDESEKSILELKAQLNALTNKVKRMKDIGGSE